MIMTNFFRKHLNKDFLVFLDKIFSLLNKLFLNYISLLQCLRFPAFLLKLNIQVVYFFGYTQIGYYIYTFMFVFCYAGLLSEYNHIIHFLGCVLLIFIFLMGLELYFICKVPKIKFALEEIVGNGYIKKYLGEKPGLKAFLKLLGIIVAIFVLNELSKDVALKVLADVIESEQLITEAFYANIGEIMSESVRIAKCESYMERITIQGNSKGYLVDVYNTSQHLEIFKKLTLQFIKLDDFLADIFIFFKNKFI